MISNTFTCGKFCVLYTIHTSFIKNDWKIKTLVVYNIVKEDEVFSYVSKYVMY